MTGQVDYEKESIKLNEVIRQVFSSICFEKGSHTNIHKLKDYFVQKGVLINYNGEEPIILDIDSFIVHFNEQVSNGILPSLEDREIHEKTEIYGNIAHRYSFYEARFNATDETPFAVGVNSIQMINIDGNWKITSMAWNDDRKSWGFFKKAVK